MFPYQLEDDPPWFSKFLVNFSHFLVRVTFKKKQLSKIAIKNINDSRAEIVFLDLSKKKKNTLKYTYFTLELGLIGFKGMIFYIYNPSNNKIRFDIFKHSNDRVHALNNLYAEQSWEDGFKVDFIFVPFGKFENTNKLMFSFTGEDYNVSPKVYYWTSSRLYKNLRSIITVNKYLELKPTIKQGTENRYYSIGSWFSGNLKEMVKNLVNNIAGLDGREDIDLEGYEMKSLISKANDFLLRIPEFSSAYEHLLKELKSLKERVEFLSKNAICSSLDDIIDYYSP
ncbi:MAG: hypothetical protein JW891_17540 [Candidatus Lokiarchaeota archaeon]|nr:hypothetical protein [Candidatus Lokiarchaeota archaeon]